MLDFYFKICYNYYTMKSIYEYHRDKDNLIKFVKRGNSYLTEHYHSKIELYYALSDGVVVCVNGVEYNMKKNSFIFVDSFDVHSNYGSGDFLNVIIPDIYFESYKKLRNGRTLKRKYFYEEAYASKVYSILSDLDDALSGGQTNFLQLDGIVGYLLGTIVSFTDFAEEKRERGDALKEILVYINDNYRTAISLETISKKLGFNRHYVSHLLGKSLSANFNDYVNGLRIEYFVNNVDGEDRISKVAMESGFTSMATFYRAFEKRFDCSPKKFVAMKMKSSGADGNNEFTVKNASAAK